MFLPFALCALSACTSLLPAPVLSTPTASIVPTITSTSTITPTRPPTLTPTPSVSPTLRTSPPTRVPTQQPGTYVNAVNPQLKPFTIRLVRDAKIKLPAPSVTTELKGKSPTPAATLDVKTPPYSPDTVVGWIQILKDGKTIAQQIDVRVENPYIDWVQLGLLAEDIDMDTYTDIAVAVDFGSKWTQWEWWVYDPASGLYKQTELSKQVSALTWSDHVVDASARELRVMNFIGVCPNEKVYRVEAEKIIFARTEGYTSTAAGCVPVK
jgi:hypothetical protein